MPSVFSGASSRGTADAERGHNDKAAVIDMAIDRCTAAWLLAWLCLWGHLWTFARASKMDELLALTPCRSQLRSLSMAAK